LTDAVPGAANGAAGAPGPGIAHQTSKRYRCPGLLGTLKNGTYQVQTNLSMQTIETSIWVIISTSKGRGAERWKGGFAKV